MTLRSFGLLQKYRSRFWDFLSGRDGESPHIGENGNWYIGNKDTKIKATGKDGKDGINGKDGFSAYELWKQSVAGDNINWPKDQTTMEHFFLYLKGKDGEMVLLHMLVKW